MGYSSVAGLRAEQRGAVLHLTFDRADRRNAVNDVMLDAMIGHLANAGTDESVRVIRIDANGPDFCAGADLIANNARPERKPRVGSIQRRLPNKANRLIPLMLQTQVPIVAVVRGWAAGLGFHIALAADFCVAADDARFWEPFMARGFTPTAAPPGCCRGWWGWSAPGTCCCWATRSPAARPPGGVSFTLPTHPSSWTPPPSSWSTGSPRARRWRSG